MEDQWKVQQVVLRVARHSDGADVAEVIANFSDEAVLEAGGRIVEGREAIFEFFARRSVVVDGNMPRPQAPKD